MLCIVDVDTSNQELAARMVCALLEIACEAAQHEIRAGKVPDLYRSGVRYVPQSKEACAFRKPSEVLARMGGDCKQLTLWRIAELRNAGIHATPRVVWIPEAKGFRAHMLLRHPDGRTEDPSINLGMKTP